MDKNQYSLIEEFGIGYKKFGHSNLMGRVVGLMLTETRPLTIDEIGAALSVTRSPVNDMLHQLEDHGFIRRVWVKGDRKQHFEISGDVFSRAARNQIKLFEENLDIAERHLEQYGESYQRAKGEEKENLKIICSRLIMMREYNRKLIAAYISFLESWSLEKVSLPEIDDMIKADSVF